MTLILKQLFSFFKLLNSDADTRPLALGLALGIVLGFSPFISLQTSVVLFLCFIFRIQLGAAFLSAFFFKFIAFVFDPLSNMLGKAVLESTLLRPIFIELYNLPIVPLTRFNNSIIMGSGLIAFIFVIPSYFLFKSLIVKYRAAVVEKYQRSKIWKAWASTSIYQWYCKYNSLYG